MTGFVGAKYSFGSKQKEQIAALVINVSLMMMSRLIGYNWLD